MRGVARLSFIDDGFLLLDDFMARDYSRLEKKIRAEQDQMACSVQNDSTLAGCCVYPNIPLTELFGDPFFVVRFRFANIDTMHDPKQEQMLIELIQKLKQYMSDHRGYYNLRIPAHIVDAIKAYNHELQDSFFCGGTVEEFIAGKKVSYTPKEGVSVKWADRKYAERNKERLSQITFESFSSYQGQYHISPVTQDKAGLIYENWIRQSLDQCNDDNIIVAEIDGQPVGYLTTAERENAMEVVLSAVGKDYREKGAYRAMISELVNHAMDKGKAFIISTQFDNFIVQGVWNSIGLKPYYSIYNIHIDKR